MSILKGIKILDFSTRLPGPYATMMFADLGAEILRVEAPHIPDNIKVAPPFDGKQTTAHAHLNRSKRSIALDLKKQASVEIVKRLVKDYDIVLEQFRPGVMERLGLSYQHLKKENPKLIYCALTGYGQTGPYKQRPGHDNNYLSIAGIADYSRRKNEAPVPMGIQVADVAGGSLHAVIGILLAIIDQKQTGKGQFVDVSMTDGAFAMNSIFGSGYLAAGVQPEAEQLRLNGGSFYDYYETKDKRYFSVGSIESKFRRQLCEAIGKPELIDIAFSENRDDQVYFKQELKKSFLKKNYNEWLQVFDCIEASVEPVLTFSEAANHPQILARDMIVNVPKDDGSMQQQIGFPIKLSNAKIEYKYTGGDIGTDTVDVLREMGYEDADIKKWQKEGAFG